MQKSANELIDELIAEIGNLSASLGINRVAGQLYMMLFLSERPVSLDEMMERLKISKGHVSTNIRALERWQAVRKIWVKGSRKDFYEANNNTIGIIIEQLNYGMSQRMEKLDRLVCKAKSKLSDMKNAESDDALQISGLIDKVEHIEKMRVKVKTLLNNLNGVINLLK